MRILTLAILAAAVAAPLPAQAPRPIVPADLLRLRGVGGPQVSPDGDWVAFTVSRVDSTKDKRQSDVYMVRWDGTRTVQLTASDESEADPRWSPDGRYLSFVSSRQGGDAAQLWLLDRAGGEAQRVTALDEGVEDYAWSPDGSRIVIYDDSPLKSAARAWWPWSSV